MSSFKRLAELKVAIKEGSPSSWADVWVAMGSVNDWECGLSSPVILCRHLRHLIVLPRQASDIKVNSSATHTWGLAPQIRFVSLSFSTLLETRTVVGLLAFIFPNVGYLLFLFTLYGAHIHAFESKATLECCSWGVVCFCLETGSLTGLGLTK